MPIEQNGNKVYRKKSVEAEKAYEGVKVLTKTISTGMEIVVNTSGAGGYENVKFNGKREITVEDDLTDEQEYEIHKDLFLDCAADIVAQGHMIFKQWNRMPKSGWPRKLGLSHVKPGNEPKMDEAVVEERK